MTTLLLIVATTIPSAWECNAYVSPGDGEPCNSAGNVAVGDYWCSMGSIGVGDCACDFTQPSGNAAFQGTVNCGECGGILNVPGEELIFDLSALLAGEILNLAEAQGTKPADLCGTAGVDREIIARVLRGDFRDVGIDNLLRLLTALRGSADLRIIKPLPTQAGARAR